MGSSSLNSAGCNFVQWCYRKKKPAVWQYSQNIWFTCDMHSSRHALRDLCFHEFFIIITTITVILSYSNISTDWDCWSCFSDHYACNQWLSTESRLQFSPLRRLLLFLKISFLPYPCCLAKLLCSYMVLLSILNMLILYIRKIKVASVFLSSDWVFLFF